MKGFKTHRHEHNTDEKLLHDTFINEHGSDTDMSLIVFGDNGSMNPVNYLTNEEKQIVISTIQWLGSPVGKYFLSQCGFEKIKQL